MTARLTQLTVFPIAPSPPRARTRNGTYLSTVSSVRNAPGVTEGTEPEARRPWSPSPAVAAIRAQAGESGAVEATCSEPLSACDTLPGKQSS